MQLPLDTPITHRVVIEFLHPESASCLRNNLAVRASVPVPEAAVYEDHFPSCGEDNIRTPRKQTTLKPKTIAHAVEHGSDHKFRLRVSPSNAAHVSGANRIHFGIAPGHGSGTE